MIKKSLASWLAALCLLVSLLNLSFFVMLWLLQVNSRVSSGVSGLYACLYRMWNTNFMDFEGESCNKFDALAESDMTLGVVEISVGLAALTHVLMSSSGEIGFPLRKELPVFQNRIVFMLPSKTFYSCALRYFSVNDTAQDELLNKTS